MTNTSKEVRSSQWKDCAECESPRTVLADDNEHVECEDCGAVTDGINGWAAL